MNPDDAVQASAARISLARGQEMRGARSHQCRRRDCLPLCEIDLMNDGRLTPKAGDPSFFLSR